MPSSPRNTERNIASLVAADRGVRGAPIQDYINDADDAHMSRFIATHSELPVYSRTMTLHQTPSSVVGGGTSMLQSGNPSLPALTGTRTCSSSCSVSSSIGHRVLPMRILEQYPQQPLSVPPPPGPIIYECPFNYLHCLLTFGNFADWYAHSLTHFEGAGPPMNAECCFCDDKFQHPIGDECWRSRMEHVELHHQWGHRLSHARPAFGMMRYLWERNIIENAMYRELSGTPASRTHESPVSPRSGGSTAVRPTSPDDVDDSGSVYTVSTDERRRERNRRRQERLMAAESRIGRR